jgi:iron complex outermembrane receptor protein
LARVTPLLLCALVMPGAPAFAAPAPSSQSARTVVAAPQRSDDAAIKAHAPATPQDRATTLGTVEVRGTRAESIRAAQAQVPGSVYAVDGQSLRERAVNNLADALRYVPGVMARSNAGGDDMVLSIRGSNLNSLSYDNSGVALFQDGLPVTTADDNNHNRMLDPLMARDVIVANGINALTYGASDLGGAIDFISRTARNTDPREVFLSGGSHGQSEAGLSAGGISGAFDGMVTLGGKHFDGYRGHSQQNRDSLYANGGWQPSDDFGLRVFATHIDNRQQLPGALTRAQFDADPWQAEPSYAAGNHQLNVRTDRLAAKGTWNIDDASQLEFGASYERQRLFHPIVDVYVPAGSDPDAPLLDIFSLLVNTDQRTSGGMLRYHLHAGRHDLLAGLDVASTRDRGGNYANDAGHRGELQDRVDKLARSTRVFAMDRWQFAHDWRLVYGAQGVSTRLDDRQIDGVNDGNLQPRNQKNRFSSFNPRVGVIHALTPDSEAYASVGRLYQSPSNFDLDNARQELGPHANLEAMHGTAYEAGLRGTRAASAAGPRWHWKMSAYYERIHNEIFSVDDPNAPGISLTSNLPRTIHAGIEALLRASVPLGSGSRRIEPLVSFTWNDFHFGRDPAYASNRLPSAPRYAVHAEVMVREAGGFYAGPTFDAVGARYADFANTWRVGGYALAGLRAGFRHGRWEWFAEIENLFDRRYPVTVAALNRAGADAALLNPGAPRSVYAGVRWHY